MGLRSENAVSAHLLLENAHESNLVSDVSKVDYLAGNRGRTHLRPFPGLPSFVDDVYVFGYMRREDCVFHRGHISCTTGEDSSAKNTVARISTAARESLGTAPDGTTRCNMQTNIVHTLTTRDNAEGGAIRATVSRIEYDIDKKAQAKWRELYPDTEPAGLFVAKVDVSEIPMDELQASLPAFERLLLAHGYGIYCIDYTQDFSGVLDREGLPKVFASKATWPPPCAQTCPRYWRTPAALGTMSAHGCAQAKPGTWSERRRTTRSYRTSRRARSANPLVAIWPTMSTARTSICDAPSCTPMYRPGAALASKSLCTPAAGETKRWWRRPWPWFPPRICQRNKVCVWSSRPPSSGRTWPRASIDVLSWPTGRRARYSSPGTRIRQQAGSRVPGSGPPRQTRTKRRLGRGP